MKVSAPSDSRKENLTQGMKEAMDILASKVRQKAEANGRGAWGVKSVSFGLTMGAGSQVSLFLA